MVREWKEGMVTATPLKSGEVFLVDEEKRPRPREREERTGL